MLGPRNHTAGNATRYRLDYSQWLEDGSTLTTAAVTTVATDVTISLVTVNPDGSVTFLMAGGVLNEVFTLNIQVRDSRTEIANDTIVFTVIAP